MCSLKYADFEVEYWKDMEEKYVEVIMEFSEGKAINSLFNYDKSKHLPSELRKEGF